MATIQTDETPQAEKKARHRSPNYPAEGLESAIKRVKKLYDEDHEAGSTVNSAVGHMGFKRAHGDAMAVLAALKKFGLVEMRGGRVYVTKRAVNILLFPTQERGRKSLTEAVLLPNIYRELFNRFKGTGFPSDQTLRAELIADYGFNPNAVDAFLKDFRSSLKLAGISPDTQVELPEGGSDEQLEGEEPALKEEEIFEKPEISTTKPSKSKIFNVALDPITSEAPLFAQVLIPIPLSDDQKKRLINFLQNL
jgi:hypothetical protein